MKMDRNENDDGLGKYAVLNLRKLKDYERNATFGPRWDHDIHQALQTLEQAGVLDWGLLGSETEFFLLRLKDRHAQTALIAYADSINQTDKQFAGEVYEMAQRAGPASPFCKDPD